MLFLISAALALIFALSVTHFYRPPHIIGWICGVYVLIWAQIVIVTQTIATFTMLRPYPYLAVQAATTLIAVMVWWRWRRHDLPALVAALRATWSSLPKLRTQSIAVVRRYPLLVVLLVGVIIAASVTAWSIVNIAPNSGDSMRYHISRVGYWMQYDNLYPFPTNNLRHTTFPLVTSLGIYWLAEFGRNERLFGFIQWTALVVSVFALYGCSRALNASRASSLFGALIFATLPNVVMQSGAPRNDLLTTTFGIISLYALWVGLKQKHRGMLVLSAIAFGVGIGTRPTLLFVAPGVLIGLAALWWTQRDRRRLMMQWVAACTLSVIVLASYLYIVNFAAYDTPFGDHSTLGIDNYNTLESRLSDMIANMARSVHLSFDFTTLPPFLRTPLTAFRDNLFYSLDETFTLHMIDARQAGVLKSLHTYVENFPYEISARYPRQYSEELGSYGLLIPILLAPAIVRLVWLTIRRRDPYLLMLAASFFSGWVVLCLIQIYVHSYMRYLMMIVVLGCVAVAVSFPTAWLRGLRPVFWVGVALYVMSMTLLYNRHRPLTGDIPIYARTRVEQITTTEPGSWRQPTIDVYQCVPAYGSELGLMYTLHTADYMYFGAGFTRTLTQIVPQYDGSLLPDPAARPNMRFILAHYLMIPQIPENFTIIRQARDFTLFARDDTLVTCEIIPHPQ